ncbi:restin homolog isoform X1 [Patella vulgata]|uniref:restin homolog isoform X1 n=2 Tax=Patella vulgata TaxID=6465 RepID=UPI0024A971F3|nr:restin homolog isoform X1 [Patella vulgata]
MKPLGHKNARDPFQCNCSVCVNFWKNVFGSSVSGMFASYETRLRESSNLGIRIDDMMRIGDRVSVHGKTGIVRYVGFIDDNQVAPRLYVGVKLDDNVNSLTNGLFEGKRYFYCTPGHGIMVPYSEVKRLRRYVKVPSLTANSMFPSWQQVRQGRKERQEKLDSFYRTRSCSPRCRDTSQRPAQHASSFHHSNEYLPRFTTDKNDIAYKDKLKYQSGKEKRETLEKLDEEKSIRKEKQGLKKLFGTGEQAERLHETLKYLQRGYEKGEEERLKCQRHHASYDVDL